MAKISNQWAIRDSGTILFKEIVSNEIKAIVTSSKTFELSTTAEKVFARGGYGNPKIVSFRSNKETTVTATAALFDNSLLSIQLGTDLETGEVTIPINNDKSVAKLDGTDVKVIPTYEVANDVFFSVVQLIDNGLTVSKRYELNPTATDSATLGENEYAVISGEIILPEDEVGMTIALFYEGKVDNAYSIINTSKQFAGEYRVEVEVIVKDAQTSKEYSGLLIFPKASLTDEITLSLSVDGDPSVMNIGFEALEIPGQDIQYQLVIFDKDEIVK